MKKPVMVIFMVLVVTTSLMAKVKRLVILKGRLAILKALLNNT
jgi:hypothetical protein